MRQKTEKQIAIHYMHMYLCTPSSDFSLHKLIFYLLIYYQQ